MTEQEQTAHSNEDYYRTLRTQRTLSEEEEDETSIHILTEYGALIYLIPARRERSIHLPNFLVKVGLEALL